MPELAEIRIMSDYINRVCQGVDFTSFGFSSSAMDRNLGIVQPSDLQIFSITAESRGKELILNLTQGRDIFMKISFSMGMSGSWKLIDDRTESIPKHTHLKFNSISRFSLCLVDVRRFAKWKVVTDWSQNRGPDPTREYDAFVDNLHRNKKRKVFNKPICEILMDQKYFNGIGNYLRAEILYRADIDPWLPANEAVERDELLSLCKQIPIEAYQIGGGSIKDWKNPNGVQKVNIMDWMQCYGKEASTIDGTGRTLWFNHKYSKND
jgi:endonuclease VIII-like 1